MPSALRLGDHQQLIRLHNDVLPWLIGGLKVRRRWFVFVESIHSHISATLSAVAALGVGAPIILPLLGQVSGPMTGQKFGETLMSFLGSLPPFVGSVVLAAVIIWVVLRVAVSQNRLREQIGRAHV